MSLFSNKNARYTVIGAACGIAVVTAAVFFMLSDNSSPVIDSGALAEGRAFLQAQEAQGVDSVIAAIKAAKFNKVSADAEAELARIDSGETNVWSLFGDSVILGDSRADDFQYFGYLPDNRILADMGAMCTDAEQYLQTATDLWPTRVFFTYGLNDVDGCWMSSTEFKEAYSSIIRRFMADLPYADFYVCTIIPVTQGAIDFDSNFVNLPEYNQVISEIANELGIVLIDCDHLLDGHEDLYADDGQHFYSSFYPIWGAKLAKTAIMNEYGLLNTDAENFDTEEDTLTSEDGDNDESDE